MGVAYRAGRTSLCTEPAVHALTNIDIEVGELALLGLLVHVNADRNTGNRTDTFASQAAGADIHIDFENPPVAPRQSFLDRHWNLVRVLDRHRTANQVRKGNGHPLENRGYRILDIFNVTRNTHKSSTTIRYAV